MSRVTGFARLGSGSLGQGGSLTMAFTAMTLATNLITGVITARALGASGRGELAAILTLPQLLGFAFAMGCRPAVSWGQGRDPADGAMLLTTWLIVLIPLGLLATAIGELLVPTVFAAQTSHAQELARIYLLTVSITLIAEAPMAIVLGDHDFLYYNALRLAQPLATAAAFVLLAALHRLTVTSAIITVASAAACCTVHSLVRVVRRHGLMRPARAFAHRTLAYGARAHGVDLAGLLNHKLDITIMPAFLAASNVGLYSVAVNVSGIVATLFGGLSAVLLPVAARAGRDGIHGVLRTLSAALVGGMALAIGVGLFAGRLVQTVYGPAFSGSTTALRILLPASVLLGAGTLIGSGLYALERPLTASIPPVAGLAVTIIGLVIVLPGGGIAGAAIVSLLSYAVVFLLSLELYRRAASLSWPGLLAAARGTSADMAL